MSDAPCLCDDVGGDGYAFCIACTKRRADDRIAEAAPDLLAALKSAVTILSELPPSLAGDLVLNDVRAVIAKATGK